MAVEKPLVRPMPTIDTSCHELRIPDQEVDWRLVYSIEAEAILILDVFAKKTRRTPKRILESCARRLTAYRHATERRK